MRPAINPLQVAVDGAYDSRFAVQRTLLGQRFNFPAADVLCDICEIPNIQRPLGAPDNYRIYLPIHGLPDDLYDVEVVSDSADDNPAGPGIHTVQVHYLDQDWVEKEFSLTMNGTTPVAAGIQARRINDFHAESGGQLAAASGNISLRTATGETVQAPWTGQQTLRYISQGGNKDMTALYTVPMDMTAYFNGLQTSSANADQSTRLRANVDPFTRTILEDRKIFLFQSVSLLGSQHNGNFDNNWLKFPETSDVKISCAPVANNADASCSVAYMLINNRREPSVS